MGKVQAVFGKELAEVLADEKTAALEKGIAASVEHIAEMHTVVRQLLPPQRALRASACFEVNPRPASTRHYRNVRKAFKLEGQTYAKMIHTAQSSFNAGPELICLRSPTPPEFRAMILNEVVAALAFAVSCTVAAIPKISARMVS